jgi:hypothetical protein
MARRRALEIIVVVDCCCSVVALLCMLFVEISKNEAEHVLLRLEKRREGFADFLFAYAGYGIDSKIMILNIAYPTYVLPLRKALNEAG